MKANKNRTLIDITIIAILVISSRMLVEKLLPLFYEGFGLHFSDFLFQNLSNYPLTLAMIAGNFFIAVHFTRKMGHSKTITKRYIFEFISILLISLIASIILKLFQKSNLGEENVFFDRLFLFTFITNTLFNVVVVLIIDLVLYYRWSTKKAIEFEIKEKTRSDYQYQLLKSQLNPHFLFNSLNVLDYLIQTDADKASNYVKRLAGVYRYLLQIESQPVVFLEEESAFVKQYTNLLQERFGAAIRIDINIPDAYSKMRIIPCGIQMHIENAVKHNIAKQDQVLRVDIFIEDGNVIVRNNIQRKRSLESASGLGLINLRKQYHLLLGKEIGIIDSGDFFIVRIPLLDHPFPSSQLRNP